jgi:hypothetical protein
MAIEQQQVNVQDLQRLNDAITITMDCIRRVVPQLAMLSQTQLPFAGVPQWQVSPIGPSVFGNPYQQTPFYAHSYGPTQGLPGIDPITAAYVQGHVHGLKQVLGPVGGIGQQGFGGIGQQGFGGIGQQGFGGIGQQGFAGIGPQGFAGIGPQGFAGYPGVPPRLF